MRFWDSSALLPLFVAEGASSRLRSWAEDDDGVALWVLTDVELRSGLAHLVRANGLSVAEAQEAARNIEGLIGRSLVIDSVPSVSTRAKRILMVHPLPAADALQLGAALVAAGDDPHGFEIVCTDEKLSDAARREGFTVRP